MAGLPKTVHVNVTTEVVFKTILLLIFFYVLYIVRDIVLVVLTSVVIAAAIEPFVKWFKQYKVGRLLAVIIVYAVIVLFFTVLFYFFLPQFISDVTNFIGSLPEYIESIALWNPIPQDSVNITGNTVEQIQPGIVENVAGISIEDVFGNLTSVFSSLSSGFVNTLSTIFGGALSFMLIVVLSFYLAVQEDGVSKFLRIITPIKHEKYVLDLWQRSQTKIGLWMQGQLLLGLVVGVLVFLGLTIIGVENALVFALLAMIFELIPLFGPILAAIPPVALGFLDGGTGVGIAVIFLFIIIQQFENHLIYPLVVKKIVGLPAILVILALIVGGKLAGFLGILLSVPLAAILMEYIDDVQKFKVEEKKVKA